jgi:hypothetical protein
VRKEAVLYRDKEERIIMHTMKRQMLNVLVASAIERLRDKATDYFSGKEFKENKTISAFCL